jgi:spore germination protein GerM
VRSHLMRKGSIRRGSTAGLAILALCAAGCGVSAQSDPQPVDSGTVDQHPAAPGTGGGTALYFVRANRLDPVHRQVPPDDRARLSALLAGVSEPEAALGLRTAIPSTIALRDVRRAGSTVTVDLTGGLGDVSPEEQTVALAQIVFTATESGPTAVRLLVDGTPVQVPRADGTLDSSDLDRADFRQQAPEPAVRASPSP